MRFMIIVKGNADTEAGVMPAPEVFEAMGRFNDQLIAAGVLLGADGLHPTSEGARVTNQGGRLVVVDGPFAEAKETISYALYEVPYKAMPAEMTGDYHERTSLLQWRMVFIALAVAQSVPAAMIPMARIGVHHQAPRR